MVPLDERPCNSYFPTIMPKGGYDLILPPAEIMGLKKRAADTDALEKWVMDAIVDADYAILALDTLIYGGLIPSRLHHTHVLQLKHRADIVRRIREKHPKIKIYAFLTIMRCPWYSISDEEPDYYSVFGSQIHRYGKFTHRRMLGILTEEEGKELSEIEKTLDKSVLKDYTDRRQVNIEVLIHTLDAVSDAVIDGFIIPQDDSARYGFTALDQLQVQKEIKARGLQLEVPVYPAADDTGMTLLARTVNDLYAVRPKVYVYYAAPNGAMVTPSFEDRIIDATVKQQIRAAGCLRVYSLAECDVMLAINIGSDMLYEDNPEKRAIAYDIERSLAEYIDQIEHALSLKKIVAVADVAYPTHSDLELMSLLQRRSLLLQIHAYAGWNTSSNTIGTVLCQACLFFTGRDERSNRDFLIHRYYDDVGYCSRTRTWLDVNIVPKLRLTVFELDGATGKCTHAVRTELLRYMAEQYPEVAVHVTDMVVTSPWNRTFEMHFELSTKD